MGNIHEYMYLEAQVPESLLSRWERERAIQEERDQYAPLKDELFRLRLSVTALATQVKELSELLASKPITTSFYVSDLSSASYKITAPLPAYMEIYDEEVIVQLIDVEVHGSGTTPAEAVQDLKYQVIKLYEDLQASKPEELGPAPERWKNFLNERIKKIGTS